MMKGQLAGLMKQAQAMQDNMKKAQDQLAQIGGKDTESHQPAGDSAILEPQSFGGKLDNILVTKVAGPALSHILPRVAGVVAELGGSTSHLASLARERGIPMVLGVLDATRQIPDGSQVAVDGVAGVVRWLR